MTLDDEMREDVLKAMIQNCHIRHASRACVCSEMQKKFEVRWGELVTAAAKLQAVKVALDMAEQRADQNLTQMRALLKEIAPLPTGEEAGK